MLPYRVWNSIAKVRVEWKLGGVIFGPRASIAILALLASAVLLVQIHVLLAVVVVFVGLVVVTLYATLLSRLEPTGTLSETTQLKLLRRGLRSRHTTNFKQRG
ncbi:Uncharacterised protein (plasmid) [Tsukamurella tyrosinosolvens]|uniref:Uncharacterized protein n=1 Tax=Tsukamurella tyrosinosolvens TaxID=57704 RepID=A0A1H4VSW0_TSUTY|nr:hypothetical protein [Tsukamurella tyrosinosolvens]KXO90612.1 hypothetical protein AXK58_22850 [Tsukamurella tyrosinosolvens]SEC84179.1 hypothetical protein SAMN04489793_3329 [Tsukamurella tyrosinosolvens]VEH90311.1 Uncharacterised protein [Tsukamurella tyrosinosolvens]